MTETVFELEGFRVKRLRRGADDAAVNDLGARCADYVLMLSGQPPGHDSSTEFFAAAPDGSTFDDMLKLGVFDGADKLVGLLDIAPGHPAPDAWYIGLLLIDPAIRDNGVGAAVVRGVKSKAARSGATSIVLSVVNENVRALRFWTSQGFVVTRELPIKKFGLKAHVRSELALDLRGDSPFC